MNVIRIAASELSEWQLSEVISVAIEDLKLHTLVCLAKVEKDCIEVLEIGRVASRGMSRFPIRIHNSRGRIEYYWRTERFDGNPSVLMFKINDAEVFRKLVNENREAVEKAQREMEQCLRTLDRWSADLGRGHLSHIDRQRRRRTA
jgi:hypothetical protein